MNIQNIYYCKNNKWKLDGEDYIMTVVRHVFSFPETRWFGSMNEGCLACFPRTIAFVFNCFNRE